MLAPANLKPAVAGILVKALDAVLKDPEVVRKLDEIATRPMMISGQQFAEYLAKERQMIAAVVTRGNIKAD